MSHRFAFIKLFQMQQLIEVSYSAGSHPTPCNHGMEDYYSRFLLEHFVVNNVLSHSLGQ